MKSNFINYLHGYVKIRIYGKMPEKFINLCVANYYLLWDIHKENKPESMIATLRLADFLKIRPLVLKSNTHISVIGYGGIPFIVKKIKRRKMLAIGVILFVCCLHILSSYIWFVDITGTKQLAPEHIKEIAYQYGLKPGIMKDTVDSKAIENKMLLSLPEVSWIGISYNGTRVTIEIVEKTMPVFEDKKPADIVAIKDGIIVELIALAGQPMVKVGDTVKKGDLLIKGITPAFTNPNNPDQMKPVPQPVKATGIVKARAWYESYGEESVNRTLYTRTGNKYTVVSLKLGEQDFVIKKAPEYIFKAFEVEEIHKNLTFWRNSVLTVESIISVYHELRAETIDITSEEAKDKAKFNAMLALKNFIPESAYILMQHTEVLKSSESNLVRVKIKIETIEDIGQIVGMN